MRHFRFVSLLTSIIMLCTAAYADEPADSVVYAPTDTTATYSELDGVEVVARTPIIQTEADRLIYNVAEDPGATSNNVIDLLRKVPMLSVDGEDNVKFKGGETFKFYLNGKSDPTLSSNYKEVLRSMPASSVKKIEVITEPGAKYDAEGLAGIINIVTISSSTIEGYLLNLGIYGGNDSLTESVYGTSKIKNVTFSLNYNHANWFRPGSSYSSIVTYLDQPELHDRVVNSYNKSRQYSNFAAMQISWEPDTTNLFTLSANLWQSHSHGEGTSFTRLLNHSGDLLASYDIFYPSESNNLYTGAQANWQHNFSNPEHNVVVSYQYSYGDNSNDYHYLYDNFYNTDPTLYPARFNHTSYPSHEHTMQADYTNPFNKHHTLEAGAKYIIRNNYNDTDYQILSDGIWIPDEANTASLKQFQNVGSVYASYIGKFGKFMAKAGLRYEFTHMGTRFHTPGHTDFTVDLSDPVPSALLSYKLTDASHIKASYRMSVRRPGVRQLDPSRNTSTPTAVSYGNPDLSSEHSHEVNLSYSNYGSSFGGEASISYVRRSDLIANYSFIDADAIIHSTYGNMGTADGIYISTYGDYRPISSLNINISLAASYAHFRCAPINLDNDGWGYNSYLSADYSLPHDWELGIFGSLWKSAPYMQFKNNSSFWYGISVSKTIRERLTLSLSANDFFNPMINYDHYATGPGYTNSSSTRMHNWGVRFGVQLRLGSLKASVRQTAKTVSNDDVTNGSGSSGNKN